MSRLATTTMSTSVDCECMGRWSTKYTDGSM